MLNDMQIPVMLGPNGAWAQNGDGSVQVKTLALNDQSVQFTGVPKADTFGYVLFVDTATSATPNTEPPKRIGLPTFTAVGDTYTITYTITKVTSAQAGAKCQLWICK